MKMILVSLAGAIAGAALLAAPVRADDFYKEAKPLFENCGDGSLDRAVKDGITIGVSNVAPHSLLDPKTNEPAASTSRSTRRSPIGSASRTSSTSGCRGNPEIPSLLSKRTDVDRHNIHVNPERVKVISFSGPAWWYGPVVLVAEGQSRWDQVLRRPQGQGCRRGRRLGRRGLSAPDRRQHHPFKREVEELQSLNQGRVKYVVEDDVVFTDVRPQGEPGNKIEALWAIAAPTDIIYRRRLRRRALRLPQGGLHAARRLHAGAGRAARQRHVSAILKKYGLSDRNLVWFKLQPVGCIGRAAALVLPRPCPHWNCMLLRPRGRRREPGPAAGGPG